jgi:predicted RNase H-like nuclease (RuvC/YqgF family)
VKELEEKLASNGVNVSHMSGFTQATAPPAKNNSFSATQRTSTLADNKRKELENLKVQVDALRSENDLLQGKLKSLASRKITLEAEVKDLKADFEKKKQIFIEKSENDDRFIALLKQENDKLKKDERVVTKVVYKDAKENTEEVEAYKREIDNLRRKAKELQRANQELQQQQQQQQKEEKTVKAVSEVREISADRRKQLEDEYLKSNKYLKKLSAEEEGEVYRAWKESKGKV